MKLSDRIVESVTSFLVRTLLRPRVTYAEPERREELFREPSLLIINHTSHLDGPIVNTMFRRVRIHPLAAKDRFEQRGFGFFLRHTGCIPIDRQNPDLSWIHESMRVLKTDGECIAIFPEGRHGEHRQQLPFHQGAAMLAAMTGVPLVMVYIDGPCRILGPRARLIVSSPFHLDTPTDGMSSDYINAQTLMLQDKMKALMALFVEREG